MRIMDEKGRLFGRINIIDLAVLLILVLLVGGLGYKFLIPKLEETNPNLKDVIVSVKCSGKLEAAAKAFAVGAPLIMGNGEVPATIESVRYNDATVYLDTSDGRIVEAKDPVLKDIYVTFRAQVDTSRPVLKLGTQELRVGINFILKTKVVEVTSVIESIQLPDEPGT